jgi:23S rRNA (cytosine1962-C5)-methyltransferase
MKTVRLAKGRESSLQRKHPWIFSGAVQAADAESQPGESVRIVDSKGGFLATAAWSPYSQIRARVWSFDENELIDADFIARRLQAAIKRRARILDDPARNACRLVYAESDGLPGLIVDRYDTFLVCQFLSTGAEHWKQTIVAQLAEIFPCRGIYERSDVTVRKLEGLQETAGPLWGEAPPEQIEIQEGGCSFLVNVLSGHKTGFYLDQHDNRRLAGALSAGRRVLNCFSYTGAFSVAALRGGAESVLNLDSSAPALELATEHCRRNGFEESRSENLNGNAFEALRALRREGRLFDLIVLDPPKFAETRQQFKKAARAYKDLALQAAQLIAPDGLLMSFSCSGAIDPALFQKITADGLLDAGRDGRIIHFLHQSTDHPVALPFPESLYLKGLVCQLD